MFFPLFLLFVGIIAVLYGIGALITYIVKKAKNQSDKKLQKDLLISGLVLFVSGSFAVFMGSRQMKKAGRQVSTNDDDDNNYRRYNAYSIDYGEDYTDYPNEQLDEL